MNLGERPKHFKKPRLGPQLMKRCCEPDFFQQVHVIFGGTGAVGGATAFEMIRMFEEASRFRAAEHSPRLVITGHTRKELRQFTTQLFELQKRDHGQVPERLKGVGYRSVGGVVVELTVLGVDPFIPGLENFARQDDERRRRTIADFLADADLTPDADDERKARLLEEALNQRIGKPFTDFLIRYRDDNGLEKGKCYRSVVVGIPLASVAAYKLTDLDEAGPFLGVNRDSKKMRQLKDRYLTAIRDDLARVKDELAQEVLAAHTTAVGGMYDEESDGNRHIRLGFAHSALDDKLRDKQSFAETLAELYSQRGIKMLITAAAIGVDGVLNRKPVPINGAIRRQLSKALADGLPVLSERDLNEGIVRTFAPLETDLLEESHESVSFEHGRPLVLDYMLRSGENGLFTVSNTDALYRVMRVTSSGELGLLLARTALFGDDEGCPSFIDSVCYYTETDNSRQVFDLLGQPILRDNQLRGLQPKALQDLGSAKHQGELHTLGLLILLHRLKNLDLDALPHHVDLQSFHPKEFFETHSRALTLEHVRDWKAEHLAHELRQLVTARDEDQLSPLKSFFQADPDRQEAAHRVLSAVLHATWAVPSLGTPIVYESDGVRRVVSGCYAASIDRIVTHRDVFLRHLKEQFDERGGEADFEHFVEFHIANNGFADLRPVAVLVSARSDDDLAGKVQVFRNEEEFVEALGRLEPYSYFTTSGLIALLVRLRGLCRIAHQLDLTLGTANTFRAHIPLDERARPLLVPGVVEAFRMVSEGLEKNTGTERLDGQWGYYL